MSSSSHLQARAGLLAVAGGAVLWGSTGVAVRIIQERTGLAAVPIGCLRLAVSAAALGFVFRGSAGRLAEQRGALVLAGVGLGGYQALYFVGVQDVGVSISTLLSLAVAPVALTVAAAFARRRRPSLGSLGTLLCAVGGLAFICVNGGSAAGSHPLVGVLASVGSGLGYAAATVVNRRLAAHGGPLLLTAATSAIGAIALVPVAVPFGLRWPADAVASGWLVYIGVVSTVLAYGLFYLGLRSTAPEVAGVLTLLEPLTAAVLAAVFLHEALSWYGLAGAALLLAAIAALYMRQPEPA